MRQGKSIHGVEATVLQTLMSQNFPGNIRELENIIEHAFVLCSERQIKMNHLPGWLLPDSSPDDDGNNDPVKAAQIKRINDALSRHNFSRSAAAKDLGIHKSTLFRQIKKLGMAL
jgi:transcriptional regulator with PAS, ATPase and Fis domain